MSQVTELASGAITNHDEDHHDLDRTRPTAHQPSYGCIGRYAHNSRRHALPCCGGGDSQDHRRERDGTVTTQGGEHEQRPQSVRDIRGRSTRSRGSGLLVLWAVLS